MNLTTRLTCMVMLLTAAFLSGFFYGRNQERNTLLKNAIIAFQNREIIDHETNTLSPIDMCIALGGVPNECTLLLRRVDETTPPD